MRTSVILFLFIFAHISPGRAAESPETTAQGMLAEIMARGRMSSPMPAEPTLDLVQQDHYDLSMNQSIMKTPLTIGQRQFAHGIGQHSISHLRVWSPEPISRFTAWVGMDRNPRTIRAKGKIGFTVKSGDQVLYKSGPMGRDDAAQRIDVDAGGARLLDLWLDNGHDGHEFDHGDWAEAAITTAGGKTFRLDELKQGAIPIAARAYPFSFIYDGRPSDGFLNQWKLRESSRKIDGDRTRSNVTWTDPQTGLKVEWQAVRYHDFPALEWLVYFENTGKKDTPIIENIQSMDLVTRDKIASRLPYRLHTANGGIKTPEQFEPAVAVVDVKTSRTINAGNGRSSQKNFPFFKVETAASTLVGAIGWSGNWTASFTMPEFPQLRMTAGIDRTHFRLHPGERVRMPRILLLEWQGEDKWEANARFRRLIQKHYVSRRGGKRPDPTLFCNSTFIDDGLNINQQATAENQIAHIRSYAGLGIEALVTDAGWYEGEYPYGAGNWFPMKSKFPEGIDPVAAAAKESGFIYGLWFEPERAVMTSMVGKAHPEWLIHKDDERHLVNFGAAGAPQYFFKIIQGFLDKPGFHFYRQDFNDDPLPYWSILEQATPDRVGIAEIRYVEGLYAFWDMIAEKYPDSLREECSSGGRRIDLETVMRMHIHQKSDYWFDDETDQASLWSLSQYLPNNTFVCQLKRLDDYSFHSTLASSLCVGWLARDPNFDTPRAKALIKRYKEVRHLLTGAWYPLLPYSRGRDLWIASQYDRPDLGEGMLLMFRRPEAAYRSVDLWLHGLDPAARYEVVRDSQPEHRLIKTGAELMQGLTVELAQPHSSDLITYRKLNK